MVTVTSTIKTSLWLDSVPLHYVYLLQMTLNIKTVPPQNIQCLISSPKTCLLAKNLSKATKISVCGSEISFSSSARNLGFYITHDITVELYIKKKSPNQPI